MVDFKAVGDSMERTRQTYDLAMGKMSVGRGNVVRQLEQLKSMGARTSKALPTSLLEAAEGNILAIASDVIDTDSEIGASSGILETDRETGTD
jgi:DNA recombination protein RmuC